MASRSSSGGGGGFPFPPLETAFQLPFCWSGGEAPGSSSASPASSPDSCASAPAYQAWRAAGLGGGRRGSRSRLGGGQRQSASQREKLRMRHLAQALHALRRYLPASVAPAGQSLTKIETLRLAIRYIAHLSELLGLSQETLERRRAARARPDCPLCLPELGCCRAGRASPARAPDAWPLPLPLPLPLQPPARLREPQLFARAPGLKSEAEPWLLAATCCQQGGGPGSAEGLRAEAALLPQEPSSGAPTGLSSCQQSLPEELLSFLEDFFPLAAPGRD